MATRIPSKLWQLPGWPSLSPFAQAVLAATYAIPKGETRTYAQVAKLAGYPNAFRAAGTALSKNPYAPFVPCHRVIKSDGSMGNYSGKGGPAAKKRMLEKEKAAKK